MSTDPKTPPADADEVAAQQGRRRGRPLKPAAEKVVHRLRVNLNLAEYTAVMAGWDPLVYPTHAAYFRARMCDREIRVRTRDASIDDGVLALSNHSDTLHKLGVNVNQIARRLNAHGSAASKTDVEHLHRLLAACLKAQEESRRELAAIAEHYSRL